MFYFLLIELFSGSVFVRNFEIDSTAILSNELQFVWGCYAFPPTSLSVCLELRGGTGTVGPTWVLGLE